MGSMVSLVVNDHVFYAPYEHAGVQAAARLRRARWIVAAVSFPM
jgi:hypothetical protein